jgi:hypothetical protein
MDNTILMGFSSMPTVATPPTDASCPPRIFELRTYESPTEFALWSKIKMFDDGEIAAFRRCGMLPVFFGSALFGRDMPSLTYMLAFDDWDAQHPASRMRKLSAILAICYCARWPFRQYARPTSR